MSGARIHAVIVHYRTVEETVQSARAVAETAPDAELVVVDNASGDDIALRLARAVPRARVIAEPTNRGYGAGCNRGARGATAPFLLFLNSDAFVQPGAVGRLAAALDADRSAAVVAPHLECPDGRLQPSIQRLPTPARIACESTGLAWLTGGRGVFRGHTRTHEDHTRPQVVEAAMGAALLVRRAAFEEVGGFDETFFLYAEELDLMARLRHRGHRVRYEPGATVVHVGGASAGDAYYGYVHAALRRYVRKFHGRAAAAVAGAALALGAAVRLAVAALTPGDAGRRRRIRYRAALRRPSAAA